MRRLACTLVWLLSGTAVLAGQSQLASVPHPVGAAQTEQPSVVSVVTDLGSDFQRLLSRPSLIVLGIGGGVSVGVLTQDGQITRRFVASAPLATFFRLGDAAGSTWTQIGGAVTTFTLGHALGKPAVSRLGADLIRGQVVAMTIVQPIKRTVRRTRPNGESLGFPSGHSSASFTTAAVLHRHFGWKIGLPAYAFATYVAGSRLQANKHYVSDVAFGAAIGITAGRAVTVGRGKAQFAVSLAPAPGGGAVGVTWLAPDTPRDVHQNR